MIRSTTEAPGIDGIAWVNTALMHHADSLLQDGPANPCWTAFDSDLRRFLRQLKTSFPKCVLVVDGRRGKGKTANSKRASARESALEQYAAKQQAVAKLRAEIIAAELRAANNETAALGQPMDETSDDPVNQVASAAASAARTTTETLGEKLQRAIKALQQAEKQAVHSLSLIASYRLFAMATIEGVSVEMALGEAESHLLQLHRQNKIDSVWTIDCDLLVLGFECPIVRTVELFSPTTSPRSSVSTSRKTKSRQHPLALPSRSSLRSRRRRCTRRWQGTAA